MSKNEKRKTKNSSRRKPAGDTPRAKAGSRALSSEQKTPSRSYAKPPLSPIPSGIRDSRNATQRKKPDDALLRERDFSDAIINSLPGTFYIYNEQGTMVRWNRKAIDITEYPAHRLARLHPLDFFEGDDRAQVDQAIRKVFSDGAADVEATLITRTGKRVPYYFTGKRMTIDGRNYMVGMGIDMTAGRRAEVMMRQSRERLRLLIDRMPMACIAWNRDLLVELWNPAAESTFGYAAEEAIGKRPNELIVPPSMRAHVAALWHRLLAGQADTHSVNENRTKDGRTILCEWFNSPLRNADGAVQGVLSMAQDITARAGSEVALRETERRLTMALQGAHAGAWEWWVATNRAVWSDENFQVLGLRPGTCEPSYETWLRCVHPEDREQAASDVARAVENRTDLNIEFRVIWPDGSVRWINDRGKLQCDPAGNPVRMLGVQIDITERKRAEVDRSRLLNILERSLNEVYIFDPATLRFRYVNAGALQNLGYSRDEIGSMTPVDLKPRFTEASFRALIGPLIDGRKDKEVFRTEHRRADGSLYPVEVHVQLVEYEKERMFLAVIIDITERVRAEDDKRRLQAQLLHSQKMEAVGQLAGGIAHDFNNILTAIIGYGNVALMSMEEDHPVRSYVDQMLSAADRAATLTQSLLAFSRRQIINPRAVSAGSIIERVQKLLHRIIGEDIELTTAFTAEDATVLVDAGQIEQVLINLCANARDAMPNGGHLAIETSLATIGEDYIRAHGYGKIGDYVLISVTDDGQGIDEQTRQRIFEPFFTTKEVGKGTGLGLAMAYGIVKQHSGYINVASEAGRGTTFRIYLPRHRAASATAVTSEPAPPPRGGNETVLLAEDDAQIRKLSRSVLEDFGYTVIEASDGADAVEKFREHRDRVQIIVVDVVMPKKNGREVYEAARQIKPGIKVLFMSGYPANVIASKGVLEPGITLLPKPLAPQDLLRAVRASLDL